jgi:uncharacterized RDD family membrane protein YckC
MRALKKIQRFNTLSWVVPEVFNVTPDLLGMPLARPSRRALAIGLDAAVIALLSSFGPLWLLAGIAIAGLQLWKIRLHSWTKKIWIVLVLILLGLISGEKALDYYDNFNVPITAPVQVGKIKTDLDKNDVVENEELASPAVSTNEVTAIDKDTINLEKIANLENELKTARLPKTIQWRAEIKSWENSVGAKFGWAFIYFTFLPFWWKGQTLGKKLFGLRVVELTGKPLTIMNCLGRYGGYAAGMATGMIGFVQVLWDVNRQAIQDKIAHTVVIDLRQPRRLELLEDAGVNSEKISVLNDVISSH